MASFQVGKHTLEVHSNFWGAEIVKYDGEVKAKGFSLLGHSYQFLVQEDEEAVTYAVEFKAGLWGGHCTIRRNETLVLTY